MSVVSLACVLRETVSLTARMARSTASKWPATGITPKRYFRLSDEQWAEIVCAAKRQDETASDYIRRVVLRDAQRRNKEGGG